MTINFQTRIIIYSIILGVMFAFAIYLALKHRTHKGKTAITDGMSV